jgi:hypothetical protein
MDTERGIAACLFHPHLMTLQFDSCAWPFHDPNWVCFPWALKGMSGFFHGERNAGLPSALMTLPNQQLVTDEKSILIFKVLRVLTCGHLFFQFLFATSVWDFVCSLGRGSAASRWDLFVSSSGLSIDDWYRALFNNRW